VKKEPQAEEVKETAKKAKARAEVAEANGVADKEEVKKLKMRVLKQRKPEKLVKLRVCSLRVKAQ